MKSRTKKIKTNTISVTMNPAVYAVTPRQFFEAILLAYLHGMDGLRTNKDGLQNAVEEAIIATRLQFGRLDIFNPPISAAKTDTWTFPTKQKKR